MAALPELLARDLIRVVSAPAPGGGQRRVLLWLDPKSEFRRLWIDTAAALEFHSVKALFCEHERDQLRVKLELMRLEIDQKGVGVVYLAGFDAQDISPRPDGAVPTLWSVYDQRYKGAFWTLGSQPEAANIPNPPTLLAWIQGAGARVDSGGTAELTEGGSDSLLARYAELNKARQLSDWPAPLTVSEVLQALGGDSREALRELIAAPNNAVRIWAEQTELVLAGIASAFGLRTPEKGYGPEELADSFAVQLALTEAWDAFGRPPDFPFRSRLPDTDEQREKAARFLRSDVLPHRELGPRYRERIVRLEKTVDLTRWAGTRTGQPRGLPLLARSRWRTFMDRFDALADVDWRKARDLLLASADDIAAGMVTPWDSIDGETHWFVVGAARELAERCLQAAAAIATIRSAMQLVTTFAAIWWEADRLHLSVSAAARRISGLELLRRVADLAYFAYTSETNERLTELVESEGAWPPAGVKSVFSLADELWAKRSGRVAFILSDALRFDLASDLGRLLGSDVVPVISNIPTTTPFGMAALLPLASADVIVRFDGGVSLKTSDGSMLSTREGRKAYITAQLNKGRTKDGVGFLDLDELLAGDGVPESPVVVVFDDTIDSQGHKGAEQLPGLAEELVGRLRRAVERLHDAGVAEVHVITDHGFLLLPPDLVDGLGHPDVAIGQVLRRETRWCALKEGAPVDGLVRLPMPFGDGRLSLGFPRGLRTLVAADSFMHGGISLQESVLPHLVSRVSLETPRLEVQVGLVTTDLVTGTVPVTIRPAPTALFGQRSVRIRVWTERPEGGDPVAEPLELEVRPDADELRPPLYLKEGVGLPAGSDLVLRAIEVDTGREICSLPLRMAVNWD